MGSSAVVDDVGGESLSHFMIGFDVNVLLFPSQRVAIDIEGSCYRRPHVVAVEVGDVGDGDIDVALVDAAVALLQADHELVVASHEAVGEVLQFLEGLHGSS